MSDEESLAHKKEKKNMATDRDYDKMVKSARLNDIAAEIRSLRDEASVYASMGEKELAEETNLLIASLQKEYNQLV